MLAVGGHYLDGLEVQCARMATGFAGGLGSTEEDVCGALSGGVMIIGALFGRAAPDEDDEPAIDLTRQYRERFLQAFGHTRCNKLREGVVHGPEGLGFCEVLVEQAATILMRLIDEAR